MNVKEKGRALLDLLDLDAHRTGSGSAWELPPWNHPVSAGVAPLFVASGGFLHPIGTAFVVSSLKIVLTAMHNIVDASRRFHRFAPRAQRLIDDETRKDYSLDDLNLYVLLQGFDSAGKKAYRLWSVVQATTPRPADLVYGVLGSVEGNDEFRFLRFGLSFAVPPARSRLRLIGYCDFRYPEIGIPIEEVANGGFDWEKEYSHRLMVYEGEVDLIFSRRFAKGLLEGPCVRVSSTIPHGLSGGPALNAHGYVCGVNSAGSDVSFGHGSLISILYSSLLTRLHLKAVNASDQAERLTLSLSVLDLILLGKIWTDESEQLLGLSTVGGQDAVHPMVHEDDYELAYESVTDYTKNCPALKSPYREELMRIVYTSERQERDDGEGEL